MKLNVPTKPAASVALVFLEVKTLVPVLCPPLAPFEPLPPFEPFPPLQSGLALVGTSAEFWLFTILY